MSGKSGDYRLFSLSSNRPLAEKIAENLDKPLGNVKVDHFSDGEIQISINESIRGADIFIIQSTSAPVNDNLMELLIMIDAAKRASAHEINIVIPYFGYARQDRKSQAREPITAKLVANMIERAGASRILALDLHAAQIQGFFDIPVDNLYGAPLLANYYMEKDYDKADDVVVVSPDHGGVTRARKLADFLHAPIAIVDKRRPKANVAEVMNIIGEVKGRRCLIIDDMVDTAGTLCAAARALIDAGAVSVEACCTHPVLSGPAIQRIQDSPLQEVVVTDSIDLPEEKRVDKIKQISVSELLAEAIDRVQNNESVSALFNTTFEGMERKKSNK